MNLMSFISTSTEKKNKETRSYLGRKFKMDKLSLGRKSGSTIG